MPLQTGLHLDFARRLDLSFPEAIQVATGMGARYVQPVVHIGHDGVSETGLCHSLCLDEDPLLVKDLLAGANVRLSGLSAPCSLLRPEVAVPYLEKAIRFADELGAPMVTTSEGIRPAWVAGDEAWPVLKYTLKAVLRVAERHGIVLALEQGPCLSKTTMGLLKVLSLVQSNMLQISFDTGAAILAGEELYPALDAVGESLKHIHVRDFGSQVEQGLIDYTEEDHQARPEPAACGEGVIDWRRVITQLQRAGFDGILSIDGVAPRQAQRSLRYVETLIEALQEHMSLGAVC